MTKTAVDRYAADFSAWMADRGTDLPAWLREIQTSAMGRFAEVGFPTARDERWRFTNFSRLVEQAFSVAYGVDQTATLRLDEDSLGWWSSTKVVFVDGLYSPGLSSLECIPDGVVVSSISAAVRERSPIVRPYLARIAEYKDNPFAALNTAFLSDGGLLCVPEGVTVDVPVQFLFLTSTGAAETVSQPRNLVVLGERSQATIVETYSGVGNGLTWTNTVTEAVLGEAANLRSIRVQLEGAETIHTATTQCRQGRDSNFAFTTVDFGGTLSRHDINVSLNGQGATCVLSGLAHLRENQHADNQTTIEHAQPHCTSIENFNGVFDGSSHGVFTGRVLVRPHAQRTDAMQASRSLLLTETARANTQPQLEILADDVKCTHGATVGPIDKAALFYLRSRGLTADEARGLLTYGFASEIIDKIGVEGLRSQLEKLLRARLNGQFRGARREDGR